MTGVQTCALPIYESTEGFPRKVKLDENGNAIREQITYTYNNPVFSFMNVVAPTDLEAYYGEEVFKKSTTDTVGDTLNDSFNSEAFMAEFVRSMTEDNDWYHWNVRNWGTKWDIAVRNDEEYADTTLENTDDGSLMYRFNTAWSPVTEVVRLLSEMYPSLTFEYEFEEEQGWGGIGEYRNGEESIIDEWDIPSSHADYVKRDRECSCECEPDYPEFWYEDCPADTEKYVWVDGGWEEKDLDNTLSNSVQ